ncbi:pyrimidine reductase family protein [Protofrankia coriariae]|uniref:pyrimidine reductase family protein n=1 Tax=Protofrankia coriariae TaxID=1562887 RepID=UPI001F3EB856|nr:pyrimidine reductase family protein [Protofrankia coriariae]
MSGNADVVASTHAVGSADAAGSTDLANTVDLADGTGVVDDACVASGTGVAASAGAGTADAVDLDVCYRLPPLAAGQVHVRSNFVSSIDGATEVDGRSGALGGSADRRVFRLLRWLADVVLVGAGTAVAEDYGPVVVPPDRRERRVAAGQDAVPPIAVVSAALRLDPSARLFAAPVRPLVLTCEAAPPARRKALAEVADVLICGERTVDPAVALRALGERGLGRVLCEGGPALHSDLADAGLLDELCLTFAPLLAGPDHLRMVRGRRWQAPLTMTLGHVLEEDGNLFLRYLRR